MKKLASYNQKNIEHSILDFWNKNDIFEKSLEKTKDGERFSFYDGPPFANGLPHFGHSLVTSIKDSIGRYQTMRGRYVERQNGWDCHGLPVEFAIEKQFGVSGKQQITELGIEKFNQACRDSVFTYKKDWEQFFERMGRWSDTKNAYATIDTSYTESVWWVMSQIHKKGLLYKGYKCMPYCPRCATPLSNFEVNEGYKDDVEDPSLYVKFKLKSEDVSLIAWTTTPWSLPGNAALAVKQDAEYVKLQLSDDSGNTEQVIVAKNRVEALNSESYQVIDQFLGKELVGKSYLPVFELEDLAPSENLYKIWSADFVSIEDGTGILHVAPAFGEDDLSLSVEKQIPVLQTVSAEGKIKSGTGLVEIDGKFFKGADKIIIAHLTELGLVYSAETFKHTYPFCYRCDTPLLYYAIDTWFVSVSKIKDQLAESAKDITWHPDHIKDGRFGKWLEGARDWAVSRNRYWGAPMPIWVNTQDESDYLVIESIEQLKSLAVGDPKLTDLHRPFIDNVIIEKEGKTYKRIEEVIDCWFESGSMPYAKGHYPFENADQFGQSFGADYIGEGLDQTRLWFYVLHVISTIVSDKSAYKNVLVNGMIMAADGRKLSKSLKNYPPIEDVLDDEGADSLRFYLLSSDPAMSGDYMRFDRAGLKDVQRNLFMTINNSVSFLGMYAEIDGWKPSSLETPQKLTNPLDIWLVEIVKQASNIATKSADSFEISKATWQVYELAQELSNWYIRRSRRRFWKSEDDSDKKDAYRTLHWALVSICQMLAPWSPFISDYYYKYLTEGMQDAEESVHLSEWPSFDQADQSVLASMVSVRQAVNEGLAERAKAGIKVRQPLASAVINSPNSISKELEQIIAEELNIKFAVVKKADELSVSLDTNITQTLKNEGIARDIIRNIQQARKDAGLQIENRIKLSLFSPSGGLNMAINEFTNLISKETLSVEFYATPKAYGYTKTAIVDGQELIIELEAK